MVFPECKIVRIHRHVGVLKLTDFFALFAFQKALYGLDCFPERLELVALPLNAIVFRIYEAILDGVFKLLPVVEPV